MLSWYLSHQIPATPINPRAPSILDVPCLKSIKELPDPANTGISIITAPPITLAVLRDAAALGVRSVWMQPGAFDTECLGFCKEKGITAVAGGVEDGWGAEGACVLIHGEQGMKAAGRTEGRL